MNNIPSPVTQSPLVHTTQSPPVLVTLVLVGAGSAASAKVCGLRGRYSFVRREGAGLQGRPGHVRDYSDMAVFHAEQEDLALSPVRPRLLVRQYVHDPVAAARSTLQALVTAHVPGKKDALADLRARCDQAWHEIDDAQAAAASAAATPAQDETEPTFVSPRQRRSNILHHAGELEVRKLVEETYKIPDVPVVHNFAGMIAAVLDFEEERGDFREPPNIQPAIAPACGRALAEHESRPAKSRQGRNQDNDRRGAAQAEAVQGPLPSTINDQPSTAAPIPSSPGPPAPTAERNRKSRPNRSSRRQ
jgi:hypothetical protein